MSQTSTWIRRIRLAGVLAVQAGLCVASASAGVINSTPSPVASGSGLGFVNVATIVTFTPNNDDVPAPPALDNNVVVPLKRFDSTGYIDIPFTVTPSGLVTEYQFTEFVDNNTGVPWSSYTMLLGFGVGTGFTQLGGLLDGLDFDEGTPGNTTPPSSSIMTTVNRPNEDSLVFSGGIHTSGAQLYQFRIDVPDLLGRSGSFTLRQQPIGIPEPTAIVLVSLAVVGLAVNRRRR